jgi:protein-S-isoprenylcysteine O-methyltransferase Ste14
MFFLITGLLNFATTPVDELVTRGVYGISRNPMYVGDFLVNVSIGIACLSWVFLLVAISEFLLIRYYVVVAEEPFLLEKYGDTYREYMNKTPRWIGIPKSEKKK